MALKNLVEHEESEAPQNRYFSTTQNLFASRLELEEIRRERNGNECTTQSMSSSVSRQLLDIEILYLLNFGLKSGYEIKKDLNEIFKIDISFGTIYPHLRSLEKSGLIAKMLQSSQSAEVPLKKISYTLTPLGASSLRESVARLGKISFSFIFTINKVTFSNGAIEPASSKSERMSAQRTLKSILERRGYTVLENHIAHGFSGTEYHLEMLAFGATQRKRKQKIIVKLIDQHIGAPMGLDGVVNLLVSAQDLNAEVLLLATPNLDVKIADFLYFHGITTFCGDNWQSVLSDFQLRFDKSLE